MEINITKNDLEQLNFYIENYFVQSMNDACVNFSAMAFALQSLHEAIKDAENKLSEGEE